MRYVPLPVSFRLSALMMIIVIAYHVSLFCKGTGAILSARRLFLCLLQRSHFLLLRQRGRQLLLRHLNISSIHGRVLRHHPLGNGLAAGVLRKFFLVFLDVPLDQSINVFPVDLLVDDNLLNRTDDRTGNPVKAHAGREREAEPGGHERHDDVHGLHLSWYCSPGSA